MDSFKVSSDKPVTDPENDSLGYSGFSRNIASSIVTGEFEDGMVLSIYGEWGAGKSTVLSFIEYYLDAEEEKIEVIHFNPWWFSSEEALLMSFFSQLQDTFSTWKSKGRKIAKKIRFVSEILAKTPLAEAKVVDALFKKFLGSDINSTKKEIEALLKEEKRKIVVVIDDIDRLTGNEVKQVFKIIKAVADFPYIIYILAFDREIVSKSLEESLNINGNSYIEKIIQVPFELPLPEKDTLSEFFIKKINKIYRSIPEKEYDQTYFGNIYHDGVEHFFKTPRDIIRLTNALSITFVSIQEEVNYADFLAIECIRVFEPKVYDGIRRNADLFCGASHPSMDRGSLTEMELNQITLIVEKSSTITVERMKELLSRLFPRLLSVFGNTFYGSDFSGYGRKNKRVCSNHYFPMYFRFSLTTDTLSTSEIKYILEASSSTEILTLWFQNNANEKLSTGKSKLSVILDRITDYFDELKEENIKNIISTFFSIGDELDIPEDEQENMFSFDGNSARIGRILHALFPLLSNDSRYSILSESYTSGNAVRLMCREIVIFGQQLGKYGSDSQSESCFITLEQLNELEKLALNKIRNHAGNDQLRVNDNTIRLLYLWKEWGKSNEPKTWLVKQVEEEPKNILSIIEVFNSNSFTHGMDDRVATKHSEINIEKLAEFYDLQEFEKALQQLNKDQLNKEDIQLISRYHTSLNKFNIKNNNK